MLEVGHAVSEGVEGEIGLGAGDAGEGDLQDQALVGCGSHLTGGVAQDSEDAGESVYGAEGGGLGAQGLKVRAAGADHIGRAGHGCHDVDVPHAGGELLGELQEVAAGAHELLDLAEEGGHVSFGQGVDHATEDRAGNLAEEVLGRLHGDVAVAKDRELLQGGQGVSHAAAGVANDQLESRVVVGEALLAADVGQVGLHLVVTDAVEVKALDAREDGCKNFLRVGGAHDEHNVLGRLLEGLEQGVEGRRGQHMDLVDDVDLAASKRGCVVHAGEDLLADVIHAGTGCRVELGHVRVLSGGDEAALLAGAVGQLAGALLAHEGLGKQARHGRLARAARTAEEVGMAGAALDNGTLERLDDVLLTNYLLKRLRAVLCVERFHAASRRSVC